MASCVCPFSDLNILECCGLSAPSDEFNVSDSSHFESLLASLLTDLRSNGIPLVYSSLPSIFMLAVLHQIPGSWRSSNTLDLSHQLLKHIYSVNSAGDMLSLLTTSTRDSCLISHLITPIQQLIATNGWDSSPTVKLIATWIQAQLPYPTLGTHLHLFFPILLRLLDDLSIDNQVLGLTSTLDMIRNVTRADLLLYDRAGVLFNALERFLYSNYHQVLSNYQPVILQLLSLIEETPCRAVSPHTLGLTQHDEFLSNLLSIMSLSYTADLRRDRVKLLLESVPLFQTALLPHLSQVVKSVVFCLELPDTTKEETRFLAMDLILFICQHCSQLIHLYLSDLSLSLIKVITQCSQDKRDRKAKSDTHQQLALKSVACFQKLHACESCGDTLLGYLNSVCDEEQGSTFVTNMLRKAITRISLSRL